MSTNVDFKTIHTVHCIGIGGVGISALARLLVHNGKLVSGTNDSLSPDTLDGLRAQGVAISLDLNPKSLPNVDLYIYSDAWLTNNPEVLARAKTSGAPVLSYFEALGAIARDYDVIAIAGTHGKTTTTAMTADVLEANGIDPTVIVGSIRTKTGSNFQAGKSRWFVIEADEYMRHFLYLSPKILAIINIDTDHLDYYKDLTDIQSAFRELAKKVPTDGVVICDTNSSNTKEILEGLACRVVDYTAYISRPLSLAVPGNHIRIDAAVAQAIANELNIPNKIVDQALANFAGTWRRFQYLGMTSSGVLVYDDYAHHPGELRATLTGAREKWPDKRIVAIFQPHLYSRTKLLLLDFAKSFINADIVIIVPIYAAREAADSSISNYILGQAIRDAGHTDVRTCDSLQEAEMMAREILQPGDVVMTLGAGNIVEVAKNMVQ